MELGDSNGGLNKVSAVIVISIMNVVFFNVNFDMKYNIIQTVAIPQQLWYLATSYCSAGFQLMICCRGCCQEHSVKALSWFFFNRIALCRARSASYSPMCHMNLHVKTAIRIHIIFNCISNFQVLQQW